MSRKAGCTLSAADMFTESCAMSHCLEASRPHLGMGLDAKGIVGRGCVSAAFERKYSIPYLCFRVGAACNDISVPPTVSANVVKPKRGLGCRLPSDSTSGPMTSRGSALCTRH